MMRHPTLNESYYSCIECGEPAECLYKQYRSNGLKISYCTRCEHPVDKYIEYDATIIFLDALLQKQAAYRHIIFNGGFKAIWKLGVVCLLCDTFTRWTRCSLTSRGAEQDLYTIAFISVLETFIFYCGILCLSVLLQNVESSVKKVSCSSTVDAVMVGSYGQLLAIAALIWGNSYISTMLIVALTIISQVQAYRAISMASMFSATVVIAGGTLCSHVTGVLLSEALSNSGWLSCPHTCLHHVSYFT